MLSKASWTGLLVLACVAQRGFTQENRDARSFLPPGAVVQQELIVDFENNGNGQIVLLYNLNRTAGAIYSPYSAGILILHDNPGAGITFEEPAITLMEGTEHLKLEKLRSADGKEGVLVINYHSGAGTVTVWHVLASIRNKIAILDPGAARRRILKARAYSDNGYNGVKATGDLIKEILPGFSLHQARCCPDRPTLELNFRFTGISIAIDSVKTLPDG